MEFVLYHDTDYVSICGEPAPYFLMDAGTASMLADCDSRVFTDGMTERDLWDNATILEATRDKRAITVLKANYKEVY